MKEIKIHSVETVVEISQKSNEKIEIELGKPFPKNPIKKFFKNLKINIKMPHVNKKMLARKINLVYSKN